MAVIVELLKTSIVVGTLYTLTGPNLASLATLCGTDIPNHREHDSDDCTKKKRRGVETFMLGVRWGMGNSIGLLLVAGILICLQTDDPSGGSVWMDYWLRTMLQAFVGVFLLILGIYGLVKALRNRELSMVRNDSDLEFKRSSADSSCSVGLESAITEVVLNRLFEGGDELSDGSSSGPKQPPPPRPRSQRYSRRGSRADSIVDQMVTCLDASTRSLGDVEDTLGLSEFDLRMWKAAKALTENMMLYADADPDDDWSSQDSKSVEASIRTIKMVYDEELIEPAPIEYNVVTKNDDTKVPVTRADTSKRMVSESFQQQNTESNHLLRNLSRCGNCFVCTPGVLAIFAGVIHGLSGPGEVLVVVPAVQLKHLHLTVLYLVTFCVTATLVMSGFAALYGSVCKWLVEKAGPNDEDASFSRVFLVEFGSACLSIVVGVIWLTLLTVGQLDIMAP